MWPTDCSRCWNRLRCARKRSVRIAANDPNAYRASLWAIARFNTTFLLELITCPTLVIAGWEDATDR